MSHAIGVSTDMRAVIIPRSDQINADNLLGGPITIKISEVTIRPGTEQPVSIHFDGDDGKPYKPCKSMARVMVHCWGPDAKAYVGRSMTLYCDPKVQWGGMAVGGIRISHMSHIDATVTMALTATKGNKKPFTVKPLAMPKDTGANVLAHLLPDAKAAAEMGAAAYEAFWKVLTKPQRTMLLPEHEALKAAAVAADAKRQEGDAKKPEPEVPFDDLDREMGWDKPDAADRLDTPAMEA